MEREPLQKNQTLGAKLDIGIQLPDKYQEGLTNGCRERKRTKFGRRKNLEKNVSMGHRCPAPKFQSICKQEVEDCQV